MKLIQRQLLKLIKLSIILISAIFTINASGHGDVHQQQATPLFSGLNNGAARAVKQFHHALKTGDEKLARSLLADSVTIFEGTKVERSANEYANHHMKADIKFLENLNIKTLEHQVKVTGDMAYSKARKSIKGQYKDKKIDLSTMETMILKKNNGSWLITHIHWSN